MLYTKMISIPTNTYGNEELLKLFHWQYPRRKILVDFCLHLLSKWQKWNIGVCSFEWQLTFYCEVSHSLPVQWWSC